MDGNPVHDTSQAAPVVVLARELDITTAGQLRSAFAPGVDVVIADMTFTAFCDTTCFRTLLTSQVEAKARGAELRLVIRPGAVWRVLSALGFERRFAVYPNVPSAQAPGFGRVTADGR
jgi:anti-anti-sigma factor